MDEVAAQWMGTEPATAGPSQVGRRLWIRYRAMRVRRFARRAARGHWLDGVSPWAFWGLHR